MTDQSYLDVQRTVTEQFIAFDSVDIVLTPRVRTSDGAGGEKFGSGTPRASQTFALIEPGNSGFQLPVVTDQGEQYTIMYMLLGTYDAVMERDDTFTYNGKKYKLAEIMPDNGYEKRAVVIQHGF